MKLAGVDVSRETHQNLLNFQEMLEKWTQKINLVSKSTLDECWNRHILDSAQLFPHLDDGCLSVADFGSGGGAPAIVLAILSAEKMPDRRFVLVESDQRKAAFLREAVREFGLNCAVMAARVEKVPPLLVDVVTARAFAPLLALLDYAEPHLGAHGRALFLKGRQADREISDARRSWDFSLTRHSSITSSDSVILSLEGIVRAKKER